MSRLSPILLAALAGCSSQPSDPHANLAPAEERVSVEAAQDPALVQLMDKIEARVTMPPGADPLASYRRTYAWADAAHARVSGSYRSGREPGRRWVLPHPSDDELILDGGCTVVSLSYDLASDKVEWINCNGEG